VEINQAEISGHHGHLRATVRMGFSKAGSTHLASGIYAPDIEATKEGEWVSGKVADQRVSGAEYQRRSASERDGERSNTQEGD
jgi:hypothetical protein